MTDPFDVFQVETGGSVCWLRAVATFEDAKAYVRERAQRFSCEYMILNQRTGSKFLIRLEDVAATIGADGEFSKDTEQAQ
jgi:hypothetical protein